MAKAFVKDLATYIRAGYPIVTIVSSEEDRALELIDELLRQKEMWKRPRKLFVWSVTRGFVDPQGRPAAKEDTRRPERALAYVAGYTEGALFLFRDFHPYLKDNAPDAALLIRQLRDLVPELKGSPRTLLWLSPLLAIPPELQKDVTVVDLPLPTEAEYREVIDRLVEQVRANPTVTVTLDEDATDAIVKACQGLTRSEAENALAKAIVSQQGLTGRDVQRHPGGEGADHPQVRNPGVHRGGGGLRRDRGPGQSQDLAAAAQRGLLPEGAGLRPAQPARGHAGGGARLRQEPVRQGGGGGVAEAVTQVRPGSGLRRAGGGVRGAACARPCRWPRGSPPACCGSTSWRRAWPGSAGAATAGSTTRVFGTLLTWMEEKTQPVFVVATANDISQLPPELLRKGRLDEIFFVDLPTPRNRAEILMIHLGRRKRVPTDYDIAGVVRATDGFSGAELEELVINALYEAYAAPERELKTEHLLKSAREIIPLARSRAREIATLRQWSETNCRQAAEAETAEPDAQTDTVAGRRARMVDL